MKVEKKVEDSFKPVTLTLTFETQEEYDTYSTLMLRNCSVPFAIYGDSTSKGDLLSRMMLKIAKILMGDES